MKAKYIIVDDGSMEYPYLFSPMVKHEDFASKFNGKIVSAGFVGISSQHGGLYCYGESVGLKMKNRGRLDNDCFQFMLREV